MHGASQSGEDLLKWLKEASDVVSPIAIAYNAYEAATTANSLDSFLTQFGDIRRRELVEALGFDPSQVSVEQLKHAFEILEFVFTDEKVQNILERFCTDYVKAQHSVTYFHVGGSAVFEVILSAVLVAATGGVALAATAARSGHKIHQFKKIGELLTQLADLKPKKIKRDAKKSKQTGSSNPYDYVDGIVDINVAGIDRLPANSSKSTPSNKIQMARARQEQMLLDDTGYNISPISWDNYPTIGRNGTFVSDKKSIQDALGNVDGKSSITITKAQATNIEKDFGLELGTLHDGFKIRKIDGITAEFPRSPLEGNQYFLGAGNHLPNGAPELVVKSIPTVDNNSVHTLLEVIVK